MFSVTLISAPGLLDASLLENLRNAWGGGDALWLAPDEAAEFSCAALPENRWKVWQDLQGMQVDVIVQPEENRRKKMLLADMDSTMIQQECIDELADHAGVGARVKDITARAMNGELDFEQALHERVALLQGQPASIIDQVLAERIELMPGSTVLLATMRAHGAYAALVSSGFTAFSAVIAEKLGFDTHRANRLLMQDEVLTGKVALPILGRQAKVDALEAFTSSLGISESDVLAVGDGANDLGMLGRAGAGVALHAKPSVAAECDIRVNFGDLTALLYLQGFSKSEFTPAG